MSQNAVTYHVARGALNNLARARASDHDDLMYSAVSAIYDLLMHWMEGSEADRAELSRIAREDDREDMA